MKKLYQHHVIPEIPEDLRMEVALPPPEHRYDHMEIRADGLRILHNCYCMACWMGIPPNEVSFGMVIVWN